MHDDVPALLGLIFFCLMVAYVLPKPWAGGVELPSYDISDEALARIAHEANRAYCASLGDTTQPPWHRAPAWQREAAVGGIRFLRDNPRATPEDLHNAWSKHRRAAGWVYGPVKDPDANPPTHPCLVPYEDLPPEQRFKDQLFLAIARCAG